MGGSRSGGLPQPWLLASGSELASPWLPAAASGSGLVSFPVASCCGQPSHAAAVPSIANLASREERCPWGWTGLPAPSINVAGDEWTHWLAAPTAPDWLARAIHQRGDEWTCLLHLPHRTGLPSPSINVGMSGHARCTYRTGLACPRHPSSRGTSCSWRGSSRSRRFHGHR